MSEVDDVINEFLDGLVENEWLYIRTSEVLQGWLKSMKLRAAPEPDQFPCLVLAVSRSESDNGQDWVHLASIPAATLSPRVAAVMEARWGGPKTAS